VKKYELIQVVDIEEDQENKKNVVINLDNGYQETINRGTCKFIGFKKNDYVLFQNESKIIMCYLGKEPALQEALLEIEEYEKTSEKWRDGNGHARIRK